MLNPAAVGGCLRSLEVFEQVKMTADLRERSEMLPLSGGEIEAFVQRIDWTTIIQLKASRRGGDRGGDSFIVVELTTLAD